MASNRKNLPRLNGKMMMDETVNDGIEDLARNTANALCDKYPEIDIIDLAYRFQQSFSYHIARRIGKESIEES